MQPGLYVGARVRDLGDRVDLSRVPGLELTDPVGDIVRGVTHLDAKPVVEQVDGPVATGLRFRGDVSDLVLVPPPTKS